MFGVQGLRLTSGITLFFFVWLTLQPLRALAEQPVTPTPPASSIEDTLDDLRETAERAETRATRGKDNQAEEDRLLKHLPKLDGLESDAEAGFAEVEAHLKAHQLPAEIQARHQASVAEFHAKMGELKRHLRALDQAHGKKDRVNEQRALNDLATFLKNEQKHKPHPPFDPKNLPFRTSDEPVRPAKERKEELEPLLHSAKPVQVAASELTPGLLAQAAPTPSLTPTPEDLAETEDVQITQAIQDRAAALHYNPVEIWNWVRNTIEFLPTYGSIQGSDLTLQTQRGNAFDTASLLIALLRASSIPARYVYGTIQMPAEQAMNWVGGATTPEAAQNLLGQGGIPTTALVSGGKIAAFKLEHVWVRAFVDYLPSRGAVNRQGDTWVPLDGSFKQYTYSQGMDIKTAVPFDAKGFIDRIKQSATVNDAEGWMQNVDQSLVQTLLTDYQNRVHVYIDAQNPNANVGDVIGTKTIVTHAYPFLMGSLPYQIVVAASPSASLSDKVRLKLRVNLYASGLYASGQDRALDSPNLSYGANLASLAGKRISFTYDPASPVDQAVIDDANANYQNRLPAYLVHVKPTLKIESEPVATGGTYAMGENQILSVELVAPWYSHNRDYRVTSGDFYALGLNPSGITSEAFDARVRQQDLRSTMGPDFGSYTAEMFHQIALAWWAEKHAFNDVIGAVNRVVHYQLPSHALAGSPLTVRYFFGIARSASYGSRVMDAKEDFMAAVHAGGDREQRRRFALAAGYVGSYLEAGIFDQAFLMDSGHSMSTITALKAASAQGVAIYTIDASNAPMLGRIATDPDDIQTMRDAVAAGLRVTTAQRDITVDNFTGLGYILEDPKTGAANYLISGGRNGGNSPAPAAVVPLPQVPAMPIIGLMTGSLMRSAGANFAINSGALTSIEIPAEIGLGVGAASSVIGAVLIALMIITAIIVIADFVYPKKQQPTKLRHYTRQLDSSDGEDINNIEIPIFGGLIKPSPSGMLGYGVYFTNREEDLPDRLDRNNGIPIKQSLVSCPPSVVEAKIISDDMFLVPKSTSGTLVPTDKDYSDRFSAWIDLDLTREGWPPGIKSETNGRIIEIVIHYAVPYMYHSEFFGIRHVQTCRDGIFL
jgi:transglutaminase-like putative cysteine protease